MYKSLYKYHSLIEHVAFVQQATTINSIHLSKEDLQELLCIDSLFIGLSRLLQKACRFCFNILKLTITRNRVTACQWQLISFISYRIIY